MKKNKLMLIAAVIVSAWNITATAQKVTYTGFNDLKKNLSAGIIDKDIYIKGIVVSEKGNVNLAKKAEIPTTAYIQSVDGKSGFSIRTATPEDNTFNRNDTVFLNLKGARFVRERTPERFRFENMTAANIIKTKAGKAVSPRALYMKDLTANDIYTYVTLKDVEIAVPFGSFTNYNEGYRSFMDEYPLCIRDINGNSMYMLFNLDIPYRRNGQPVPQGSGSITGVIVCDHSLLRYGGNKLGDFSIRHFSREDIKLAEKREEGFSSVLAEWSTYRLPFGMKRELVSETGKGTLYNSDATEFFDGEWQPGFITPAADYSGLDQNVNKGLVGNAGFTFRGWWPTRGERLADPNYPTDEGRGAWWLIQLSTKDIKNPLSLQIESNSDLYGPKDFVVEWTTNPQEDYYGWQKAGEYQVQEVTEWGKVKANQCPGYKVENIALPKELLGHDKVYIRLRVASKLNTRMNPSLILKNAANRISHLSIKYNK